MNNLQTLKSIKTRSKKRVGRGYGSGVGGHTAGRGQKGQKSRTGATVPLWFEGGQLPLVKRLPMWRGKGRLKSLSPAFELTTGDIQRLNVEIVSMQTLQQAKVLPNGVRKVKVIVNGELTKKVTVDGLGVSAGAKKVIESLGGEVKN